MISFILNDKEEVKYTDFCKKHKHSDIEKGAIGGNISVKFLITGIGAMPSVKCSICGEEKDITDYSKL